jgi:hypothetical protein
MSVITSTTTKTASNPSKTSSGANTTSSRNSTTLSEADLYKIVGNNELKYQAAIKIRKWLRICLLKRRERKFSSQLSHIQQQHNLMISSPHHFQETDLMSLMQLSPLYTVPINTEADPFRVMTEVTDVLLRSEIRKHTQFANDIKDKDASNKLKQQLQLIETGRREILQVYAHRVRLMATKTVVSSTSKKDTISKQMDESENNLPNNSHTKPSKKLKKSTSLRWADSAGKPLSADRVFDLEEIVVINPPGSSSNVLI